MKLIDLFEELETVFPGGLDSLDIHHVMNGTHEQQARAVAKHRGYEAVKSAYQNATTPKELVDALGAHLEHIDRYRNDENRVPAENDYAGAVVVTPTHEMILKREHDNAVNRIKNSDEE